MVGEGTQLQYSTVLYITATYNTVQYSPVLYCMPPVVNRYDDSLEGGECHAARLVNALARAPERTYNTVQSRNAQQTTHLQYC
jgi:hypothetical protein